MPDASKASDTYVSHCEERSSLFWGRVEGCLLNDIGVAHLYNITLLSNPTHRFQQAHADTLIEYNQAVRLSLSKPIAEEHFSIDHDQTDFQIFFFIY